MELYAGLDLHSRNTYIGIMEEALPRLKYLANTFNSLKFHLLSGYLNLYIYDARIQLSMSDGTSCP